MASLIHNNSSQSPTLTCSLFVYLQGHCKHFIDGLVQERHNSIVNELELRLSCTNLSICIKSHLAGVIELTWNLQKTWDQFHLIWHRGTEESHHSQGICYSAIYPTGHSTSVFYQNFFWHPSEYPFWGYLDELTHNFNTTVNIFTHPKHNFACPV